MKTIRYYFSIFSVVVFLAGLPGCAQYNVRVLPRLTNKISSRSNDQFISFNHLVYTREDCRRYLDRDVIAQGYQPIQITIDNNSDRSFFVSMEDFSFPCVSSDEVAESVHTDTVGRAVGYGVAGLFIWPLLIPAVVDGVGSAKANEKLDRDYANKTLDRLCIKPFTSVTSLVFVPTEEFTQSFHFVVIDKKDVMYELSTSEPCIVL